MRVLGILAILLCLPSSLQAGIVGPQQTTEPPPVVDPQVTTGPPPVNPPVTTGLPPVNPPATTGPPPVNPPVTTGLPPVNPPATTGPPPVNPPVTTGPPPAPEDANESGERGRGNAFGRNGGRGRGRGGGRGRGRSNGRFSQGLLMSLPRRGPNARPSQDELEQLGSTIILEACQRVTRLPGVVKGESTAAEQFVQECQALYDRFVNPPTPAPTTAANPPVPTATTAAAPVTPA